MITIMSAYYIQCFAFHFDLIEKPALLAFLWKFNRILIGNIWSSSKTHSITSQLVLKYDEQWMLKDFTTHQIISSCGTKDSCNSERKIRGVLERYFRNFFTKNVYEG